jgi:hypothetical protein
MFKVKNVGRKHWTNSSRWGMAKVMHNVLLDATKVAFASITFISIFKEKMVTIDNVQWLSIHLYVVQALKRIPILLCVERIGVFTTFDNIFGLMFKFLLILVD